ncbi:LCP family protein [Cohnella hongkongensis]|uniref:LCP family protein n=1 Tax=Cohnella hongkongensis TaxID=178337 RepID=A0ABV9F8G1_9BACL
MNRARVFRMAAYAAAALLLTALAAGGYVWVTAQRTLNAMYEPLPSAAWEDPVFETEMETEARPLDMKAEPTVEATAREGEGETEGKPAVPAQKGARTVGEANVERLRNPSIADQEPFTMLLLGVDERPWDRGRSDTMILLAVQPRSGQALALSIPRDTRVRMPNSGKYDKINHAYAFGGVALSVKAVEQAFGVPISYYMKTNMEGLVGIVDSLGGVDVRNERAFEYEGYSFPAGERHLNGEEALAYSRMRKEDPQGDFGRTQRQRQILSGAIDRLAGAGAVTKLPTLLSHLSKYVRTDLTPAEMLELVTEYRSSIRSVETMYLQGKGKIIDGIYYYTITAEERQRIQSEMLQCLNGI